MAKVSSFPILARPTQNYDSLGNGEQDQARKTNFNHYDEQEEEMETLMNKPVHNYLFKKIYIVL